MHKDRATRQPTPSPEAIAQRAYEIYEQRGGQPGHELDDWLEAEAELAAAEDESTESEASSRTSPVTRRPARTTGQPRRRPTERNSTA